MTKEFTYLVEHMEVVKHNQGSLDPWSEIEYKNMVIHTKLWLTSLASKAPFEHLGCKLSLESVSDWPADEQKRVLLLDPSATKVLSPEDAADYDFLLFGGILGDDPPQDRTRMLRKMGFAARHLGPIQMTTDTAVLVAQKVIENGTPLDQIPFIDHPEIKLRKNESVTMPFRYIQDQNGNPLLPPGLLHHLKTNDETLF